jgi:hypothetical protein
VTEQTSQQMEKAAQNSVRVPTAIMDLARAWNQEARRLRLRYGQESLALLCEAHAGEMIAAAQLATAEIVDLDEAAHVSGYSESALRGMLRSGELRNAGRRGRPRFYRSELPRKSAPPAAESERGTISPPSHVIRVRAASERLRARNNRILERA